MISGAGMVGREILSRVLDLFPGETLAPESVRFWLGVTLLFVAVFLAYLAGIWLAVEFGS